MCPLVFVYFRLFLGGAHLKGLMSLGVTTFDWPSPTKLVSGAWMSASCASTEGGESYCDLGTTGGSGTTFGSTVELVSGAQVPVSGAGTGGEEPGCCVTVGSGRSVTCAGKKASGGNMFLSYGNIPVALNPAVLFSGVMSFG